MNAKKLAIFDMDGVIVDTEPLHRKAKEIILARYGIEGDIDLDAFVGLPNEDLWRMVIEENQLPMAVEELVKLQNDLILDMVRDMNLKPMEGILDVFSDLKMMGFKIGLASSSKRYFVSRILNHYALNEWFCCTVTGDEVPRKKPFPDCYQKVLALTGVSPEDAFAVEDSTAGVKAAVSAGLFCIGFINPNSGQQNLSEADRVIERLLDIFPIIKE